MIFLSGVGRLTLSAGAGCEPAQLFFVVPDAGGEGVERGAEGADLVGQAGEGAAR
jgi:hypothetical protein